MSVNIDGATRYDGAILTGCDVTARAACSIQRADVARDLLFQLSGSCKPPSRCPTEAVIGFRSAGF
jgi:hypothetical protein